MDFRIPDLPFSPHLAVLRVLCKQYGLVSITGDFKIAKQWFKAHLDFNK